ncbi:MAG: sugar phosphate isomerase/epimerase [Niabella sp.]
MFDLGFVSAIFSEKTFEEVIDFASDNGFACVELMCWPKGKAERRYAGITHIDADELNDTAIKNIQEYLQEKKVYISALGYYPNPLDPDAEKRDFYISHLKKVIRTASLLNVPVVNTFIGRDQYKTLEENLELFKLHWPPVIQYAASLKIKIGIENCPMLFTNDEWPGGKNMAISPYVWEQLFSHIPNSYFGLNYDPSHLLWQQINYLDPLLEFKDKLFHIHLKDTRMHKEKLERLGILVSPLEFHSPKLPGLGDIDWKSFFSTLKVSGYEGPVVIEFEDKTFEDTKENVVRGLLQARDYILQFL